MGLRRCFELLLVLGLTFSESPALSLKREDLEIWDWPNENLHNLLRFVCHNYDLYVDDKKIDCYAVEFVDKSQLPEVDDDLIFSHDIEKRDVDEKLEGSGSEPESLPVEAPAVNETQINEVSDSKDAAEGKPSDASEDEAKAADIESQPADGEQLSDDKVDVKELPPNEEVKGNVNNDTPTDEAREGSIAVPSNVPEDVNGEDKIHIPEGGISSEPNKDSVAPVEENQPQETDPAAEPKENAKAEESGVVADGDQISESVKEPKDKEAENSVATDAVQVSEDVKESKDAESETSVVATDDVGASESAKEPTIDEAAQVEEKPAEKTPVSSFAVASLDTSNKEKESSDKELPPPLKHDTPKAETILPPSGDVAETTIGTPKKETESLDSKQSGSAVLDKEARVSSSSSVEGRDIENQLSALSASSSSNNEPSTGESAENVSNRSKDATILIVLFVVVLVIGAAAFTHHFIKKRKQRTEAVKTLRNGDVEDPKQPKDVEKGVEMKPLLNSNEKPVIIKEFSDTKKSVEA